MPAHTTHSSSIVNVLFIPQTAVYLRFLDSGHGGQIRDRDGDEVDGFDECV